MRRARRITVTASRLLGGRRSFSVSPMVWWLQGREMPDPEVVAERMAEDARQAAAAEGEIVEVEARIDWVTTCERCLVPRPDCQSCLEAQVEDLIRETSGGE